MFRVLQRGIRVRGIRRTANQVGVTKNSPPAVGPSGAPARVSRVRCPKVCASSAEHGTSSGQIRVSFMSGVFLDRFLTSCSSYPASIKRSRWKTGIVTCLGSSYSLESRALCRIKDRVRRRFIGESFHRRNISLTPKVPLSSCYFFLGMCGFFFTAPSH